MNNRRLVAAFLLTTLTVLSISFYQSAFTKEDGAPSANTNSPGDGRTCARDSCHTGEAVPVTGLLSADVPAAGYTLNDTITLTLSIDFPGRNTFGFQVSPQTPEGDKLGELIVTDDFQTKTTSAGKYITHEKQGIDGSDGKTWNFDWTPDGDTVAITFYYAVNAADGDGESTGDSIMYGSFTIFHDPTDTVMPDAVLNLAASDIFFIQNPVLTTLSVVYKKPGAGIFSAELFDAQGRMVITNTISQNDVLLMDVKNLKTGMYILKILSGSQYYSARIVKG